MNLKKVIKVVNIIPELAAGSKAELMEELIDLLVKNRELTDRQSALDAIWHREKLMSTGLQHGIATPHAKISGIDTLRVAIGIKNEGLDFDAMDGAPSKIFVMIFSPIDVRGPHVQFLAEIASLLSDEDARNRLLAMKTAQEIHSFFAG